MVLARRRSGRERDAGEHERATLGVRFDDGHVSLLDFDEGVTFEPDRQHRHGLEHIADAAALDHWSSRRRSVQRSGR